MIKMGKRVKEGKRYVEYTKPYKDLWGEESG